MRKISVFALSTALASFAVPAFAQSDGEVRIDKEADDAGDIYGGSPDIVVTARNRGERLIDVPVAVTAISGDDVARAKANDIQEISTLIPSLMVSKVASGTGASMSIRGVGTSYTDGGVEQTVSVNIDGFQGARGFVTNVAFLDLAQVEVLKGPQALFFGKNSPGGVISLRSNDPGADFFASVRAGYEFEADERYVEAVISTPVTDTFGVRFAGRYSDMDGYFFNKAAPLTPNPFDASAPLPGSATDRYPIAQQRTGRLTLKWEPSSDFTATAKVLYATYADNGLARQFQPFYCPGTDDLIDRVGSTNATDPYGDCVADKYFSNGDLPSQWLSGFPGAGDGKLKSDLDDVVATLDLEYWVGKVALSSITGYTNSKLRSLGVHDQTVFARQVTRLEEDHDLFSQEFRMNTDLGGPVNFSAGAYFEYSNRRNVVLTRGPTTPAPDATGNTYSFKRDADFNTSAFSAFGQVRWEILPELELAAGARFTHEYRRTIIQNPYVNSTQAASLLAPGIVIDNEFSGDNLSPEATLTWKPSDDITVYGAYKTGYKSGGATVPITLVSSATSDNRSFGPEKTTGGEVGVKGFLFDRAVTFSADVYTYTIKGLQLSSGFLLPNGIYTSLIKNAANARTRGVELEGSWRISPEFSMKFAGAYNDAKFLSFPNAICYPGQTLAQGCRTGNLQDRSGQKLARAPEWVLSGGPTFDVPMSSALSLMGSATARYTSSYLTQEDGYPPAHQDAFTTVDASIGVHASDDSWSLSLIGKNLTNKHYVITSNLRGVAPAGNLIGTLGRPLQIAVEGLIKF